MKIEAVAFDVDGTLYPNRQMYWHSIPVFLGHPLFTYHYNKVRREIRRLATFQDFRAQQAALLASRLRMDVETATALIQNRVYQIWMESLRKIRPYRYLEQALAALQDRGLKLAVMSDYPPKKKLGYLGVDRFFSCAIASEDSGHLKPDSRPFISLLDCLGCAPSRVLYVGDNYHYDVCGAAAAGMYTAHLTRRRARGPAARRPVVPDICFSSYAELPTLIDSVFD